MGGTARDRSRYSGSSAPGVTRFTVSPGRLLASSRVARTATSPRRPRRYSTLGRLLGSYALVRIAAPNPRIRRGSSARPAPELSLRSDRRHWWYRNAVDEGSPIEGALRVRLGQDDPQLIGPERWWAAKQARTLFVRGARHTSQSEAEISWSLPGSGFDNRRRIAFSISPDGRFHTTRIRLSNSRSYSGTITGLRLDPVAARDRWVCRHQPHLVHALPNRPRQRGKARARTDPVSVSRRLRTRARADLAHERFGHRRDARGCERSTRSLDSSQRRERSAGVGSARTSAPTAGCTATSTSRSTTSCWSGRMRMASGRS